MAPRYAFGTVGRTGTMLAAQKRPYRDITVGMPSLHEVRDLPTLRVA
jgi:hypothetical protein